MDADHPLDIIIRLAQMQRVSCSRVIGGMLAMTMDDIYSFIQDEEDVPLEVFNNTIADQINFLILLWASIREAESDRPIETAPAINNQNH